jgi:hypothetical protein
MPTILMKKLAGLPTLYCLQAISLIETFSLIAIWWSRLSCLLCSSADIGKSSFSLLSTTSLEMGKTHIVWDSINNSVRDVRKAITKARMLTGTYMLQTLKSKFNQAEVDPTCPKKIPEEQTLWWNLYSVTMGSL